jgi:hypothetical protein
MKIMEISFKRKTITTVASLTIALVLASRAAGPSPADVGDAETFGHSALYMGAASGFVTLSTDPCPAPTPTPSPVPNGDSFCFQLNSAPALTTYTASDVARIRLPAKATRNVIYPALNMFVGYQLENSTGVDQPQGLFQFTASLDIESTALLDPSIIDPNTGLPANGRLTTVFTYSYRDDRRMDVNDRQRMREDLLRTGNTGLTRAFFRDSEGLTDAQVDNLFKSAITIRMNVTGAAKLCTDGSITANMRLFGD